MVLQVKEKEDPKIILKREFLVALTRLVAKVFVTFENTMVENIMDSYDYTSISIFSEIGGSVGVLTGISCITIVEFLLGIQKKLFEIYQKRGKVTPTRVFKVKENLKGQLPEIRY